MPVSQTPLTQNPARYQEVRLTEAPIPAGRCCQSLMISVVVKGIDYSSDWYADEAV